MLSRESKKLIFDRNTIQYPDSWRALAKFIDVPRWVCGEEVLDEVRLDIHQNTRAIVDKIHTITIANNILWSSIHFNIFPHNVLGCGGVGGGAYRSSSGAINLKALTFQERHKSYNFD